MEHELERLDSEWNAKCSCLSSKLKLTENSLEETVSCRDNIAAQLEEKVKTCNSLKEELTATRESCTALEGWKQQILQEAKQLKQQLRLAQEEVDTQRGDKERGLDKAEVTKNNVLLSCGHTTCIYTLIYTRIRTGLI